MSVGIGADAIIWSDWSDDPYALYRALRDEQPVFHDRPNNMFVVTRYDDVSSVLMGSARFSNIPLHVVNDPTLRVSPLREEDPARHTFLRRIVMPMFAPPEMRRLEMYFQQLARELLDAAERGDTVEVSSQLAVPLPGRVTCDLLGVALEQHEVFLALTAERQTLQAFSNGRSAALRTTRSLDEVRGDLWSIVGPVLESRRRDPRHDAITLLVQAQETHGRDEISDGVVIDLLLHLLTGGFHTTQHLIELLLSLLADRPDLWTRLRADRSLVNAAIEEMLRFDAPVQALRRRSVVTTTIRGVDLPANATISLVYGSANRDERAFDDPDTYSLDRDARRHLAFSAGIHFCPGAPVTRFEVRALIDEMLDRYVRLERVAPSQRWPIDQKTVEAMHGLRTVPLRFVR